MTLPEIKSSTPVKKEGYVQVQTGAYSATKGNANLKIGALLGGEISKNGTYANAEIGVGTSLSARIKAGHEFNLGKKMGLELSLGAEYLRNNRTSNFESIINVDTPNGQIEDSLQDTWHDGYKKAGAGLSLNFNGKRGNIKVGVEGGYRANNAPDITHKYDIQTPEEQKTIETSYNGHQAGAYITPTISAELNLGKNGHWSAVVDADKFQGNAGIRYTF